MGTGLNVVKLASDINLLLRCCKSSLSTMEDALKEIYRHPDAQGAGMALLYQWIVAIGKRLHQSLDVPIHVRSQLLELNKKERKIVRVSDSIFTLIAVFLRSEWQEGAEPVIKYPHQVEVELHHESWVIRCICTKKSSRLSAGVFNYLHFSCQPAPVAGEVPKEKMMSSEHEQEEGFEATDPIVDRTRWLTRPQIARHISDIPGYRWVYEESAKTPTARTNSAIANCFPRFKLTIPEHSWNSKTATATTNGKPMLYAPELVDKFVVYFCDSYLPQQPESLSLLEGETVLELNPEKSQVQPSIPASASWQYLPALEVVEQFGDNVASNLDKPLDYNPELVAVPVARDQDSGGKAYNLFTVITAAMRLGQYQAGGYVQLSQLFEEDYTPQEQAIAISAAETVLESTKFCALKGDDGVLYTMVALSEMRELKNLTHAEVEKTRGVTVVDYFHQHYSQVEVLDESVRALLTQYIIGRFKAIAGDQLYISGTARTITIPKRLLEGVDLFSEHLSVEDFGALLQIPHDQKLQIEVQRYMGSILEKEGKIPWAPRPQNPVDGQGLGTPLIPLITVAKYLSTLG
jgi:hypothetical protein